MAIKHKAEDKARLDTAKLSYLTKIGNKVNDPNTSQKSYSKIKNSVINKRRAPKVPPLANNVFILNCKEKAKHFNVLPPLNF